MVVGCFVAARVSGEQGAHTRFVLGLTTPRLHAAWGTRLAITLTTQRGTGLTGSTQQHAALELLALLAQSPTTSHHNRAAVHRRVLARVAACGGTHVAHAAPASRGAGGEAIQARRGASAWKVRKLSGRALGPCTRRRMCCWCGAAVHLRLEGAAGNGPEVNVAAMAYRLEPARVDTRGESLQRAPNGGIRGGAACNNTAGVRALELAPLRATRAQQPPTVRTRLGTQRMRWRSQKTLSRALFRWLRSWRKQRPWSTPPRSGSSSAPSSPCLSTTMITRAHSRNTRTMHQRVTSHSRLLVLGSPPPPATHSTHTHPIVGR